MPGVRALFTQQLNQLQADFRDVAAQAAGVRLRVTLQPGKSYLGKCYALGFVRPDGATQKDEQLAHPLNGELFVLNSRADRLLAELLRRGMKTALLFGDPIDYGSDADSWIVYLLHSPGTVGCCRALGPDGIHDAYAVIRPGQFTVAWIDDYVGVCLLALAALKAAILSAGDCPVVPESRLPTPDDGDAESLDKMTPPVPTSHTVATEMQNAPGTATRGTHADGLEGGRWLWWENVRHDVPKGTVYRLLEFMWNRDSARYGALNAARVFDSEPSPQTIRSYTNKANNALPPGFPWKLSTDATNRQMTKVTAATGS
jgi:hypothetical protein